MVEVLDVFFEHKTLQAFEEEPDLLVVGRLLELLERLEAAMQVIVRLIF